MQTAVPESRADWPKLVQIAEKWTQAEPKNTDAWYELGLGLEMSGKIEQAEKAYQQAANLENTNFDAQFKLGAIAKTRGDYSGNAPYSACFS